MNNPSTQRAQLRAAAADFMRKNPCIDAVEITLGAHSCHAVLGYVSMSEASLKAAAAADAYAAAAIGLVITRDEHGEVHVTAAVENLAAPEAV